MSPSSVEKANVAMGALPWHLNRIEAVRVTSFVFPGSSAPKLRVAAPDLNLQLFFEITVAATVRVPLPACTGEEQNVQVMSMRRGATATHERLLRQVVPTNVRFRLLGMPAIRLMRRWMMDTRDTEIVSRASRTWFNLLY